MIAAISNQSLEYYQLFEGTVTSDEFSIFFLGLIERIREKYGDKKVVYVGDNAKVH